MTDWFQTTVVALIVLVAAAHVARRLWPKLNTADRAKAGPTGGGGARACGGCAGCSGCPAGERPRA